MFFDDLSQVVKIAARTNFAIFDVPDDFEFVSKNSLALRPDNTKNTITIDMVRDFVSLTASTQVSDCFFVVYHAETMNESAQNAFLKHLEEPKPHCHFVLLTSRPSMLLPTILSRAQIYYHKKPNVLSAKIDANEKIKDLAKRLITAKPIDLIKIATEVAAKKDSARRTALDMTSTAIEMLYKTFFATGDKKFLKKLPNLIILYDNLSMNGNIKLHIVADML